MSRRVVVTGIGISCSLGDSREEFINSLNLDVTGLKKQEYFQNCGFGSYYFGKSNNDDVILKKVGDWEKIECMALKSIYEALSDSGITSEHISRLGERMGVSLSSSLAGIDHIVKSVAETDTKGEWLLYSRRFMNLIMLETGIRGTCYVTSSACAAGTAGIGIAYDLIRDDVLDIAVAGGVDHLSLFSIFGFHSLRSLSRDRCKPFDKERDGINLGEGSCFLILEEVEHAKRRGASIYGEIAGYGIANDAYHPTTPDPDGYGAARAVHMAVDDWERIKTEMLYINAHGTATAANDAMEMNMIKREFQGMDVFVSSTKSRTGHCLGAAGSIELAIALLSLNQGKAYGTLNSKLDMEGCSELLKHDERKQDFRFAISNSYAFGGHVASIFIKKLKGVN